MLVVGDLFSRHATTGWAGVSHADRCRRLSQSYWGRYVGLSLGSDGSLEALFRDPSGAWDCAVWREGDLVFAASSAPQWLRRALHLCWMVDWERIADILADPILISADPPLRRVEALAPGEMREVRGGHRGEMVWTPARAARAVEARPDRARQRLRTSLDTAVEALAKQSSGILVEVSGGLDSAIVASSLVSARSADRAVLWNSWGPYREADERRYVEAISARLGLVIEVVERPEPTGEGELCLQHPPSFRPSLNRMDAVYDLTQTAVCESQSLDMILTGMGGDVALFQMATSAVLADLLALKGPKALVGPASLVLARRMRRSVWSVACRALRAAPRRLRRRPAGFVAPEIRARRPPLHPWLRDIDGLPLGKRIQIAGFAYNLSLYGLSGRTEVADAFHPFLSQPVMEACLATPTPVLTGGGHDRLLAREAFADRLPDEILGRRSKGELGTYYGRCIAAAIKPLRAHLLEGRLAGVGMLDLQALEAALQPDTLISVGGYADIMLLAGLESWTKAWSGNPSPWER